MPPKFIPSALTCLVISCLFMAIAWNHPFTREINSKVYDKLMRLKKKASPLPEAAKDIALVMIDNKTVREMPYKWPYPRKDFARLIAVLNKSNPKTIAFDFAFFGSSEEKKEDNSLADEINKAPIVLPALISEDGNLAQPSLPRLGSHVLYGIVTKLQDNDEITRKNILYVVDAKNRRKGFLSWEMQILRLTRSIDLDHMEQMDEFLLVHNDKGDEWSIPFYKNTNSFLINFHANTTDLSRVSFIDVLNGDFKAEAIAGKTVLVGTFSSLLGDFHNTPIGWLPGTTLNANVLLTLYAKTFIKKLPLYFQVPFLFLAVLALVFVVLSFEKNGSWTLAAIIIIFLMISYVLLALGLTWDYCLFPSCLILSYILTKKIKNMGQLHG